MISSSISSRLNRIQELLDSYVSTSGYDPIDQATDLITDLLHWCEAQSVQPIVLLDRATQHFVEEYGDAGPKVRN
jgi:hypothetical protein